MEASSPETLGTFGVPIETNFAGTASTVLVGPTGIDFLSRLSAGLPSECSAYDSWYLSLSISSFSVAGRTTWLSQNTPFAVVFDYNLEVPLMNFTSPSTLRFRAVHAALDLSSLPLG
jgi:hypothetical protein